MLPTVEPAAQRAQNGSPSKSLRSAVSSVSSDTAYDKPTEILGNTVDPHWRFSVGTVPTRSSLTMPGGLPFGFVIQPFAAPEDRARWLRREGDRCQSCGAFRNLYVSVEAKTGRWLCNFCGYVNTSEDLKGKEAIEACRELRDAVVEYVEPMSGIQGAELGGHTHIFVIDTTIRQRDLADMQAAVVSAIQAMHANDHVGLIAFDSVVKVFDMSKEDSGCAHVIAGTTSPSQGDLNILGTSGAAVTAPVHLCASALVAIVKSLKPPLRQASRAKGKQRCCGAAIETAIAVAAASSRKPSPTLLTSQAPLLSCASSERVIVLLGGPPTVGPGVAEAGEEEEDKDAATGDPEEDAALRYFGVVGVRARMLGVVVDVFAVSSLGVGVRRFQALTVGCGGDTVVHSSFADAFLQSLSISAKQGATAGRSRGVLDLHYSPQIDLTRLIGPVVEAATKEEEAMLEALPSITFSPAVDARHAFTGIFQLKEDVTEDFVYFQVASAHTSASGERVLRVSTQRVAVTNNTAMLVQSVDVDVAAVVMAKEAVIEVREGSMTAEEARRQVSERLQSIATTLAGQVKVTMQGRMSQLPASLAHLPQLIFHLQSGPLLGPILNDDDNVEAVRLLFLHSGVEDGRRMVCPALLSCSLDGALTFTQVPLQDLSLAPEVVVVLDHHTHIFIWSGSKVCGNEHDETRRKLHDMLKACTATRFPAPEIMSFKEGDSMARWLVCRLDPASKDAPAAGLVSGIAGAVRGMLSSRFVATDDPSMLQWLTRYRMIL